jgi:zinc transporter 1/2/3
MLTMTTNEFRRRRGRSRTPRRLVRTLLWFALVAMMSRAVRGEEEESAVEHVMETYDENADGLLDEEETSELVEAFVRRLSGGGAHAGHGHEEEHGHEDEHGHEEEHEALERLSSDDLIDEFAGSDGKLNETEFLNAAAMVVRCFAEEDCEFIASHAESTEEKDYVDLKMGLMAAIFAMGFIGGMLPLYMTTYVPLLDGATRYLNSFSGGLFLSAGFVHLLPHALESANKAKIGTNDEYPFAMVMAVLGFCLAFCIERVLFHTHSHGSDEHHHPQQTNKSVSVTSDDCEKCENVQQSVSIFKQARSALVFMAGIALHASLAGVSLGTQTERKAIISIFVAISSHKSAAAFSIGTQFLRCGIKDVKSMALFMFAFALITPIGIVIGYLAESTSAAVSAVLEGISAGTFIYVGTIEVLGDEFENTTKLCDDHHGHNHKVATHEHTVHGTPPRIVRLAKFGAYMLGVTFIVLVQLAVEHAH